MDLAYLGKMALGLASYIQNLPDEIEKRLRESIEETFPLPRWAYNFWAELDGPKVIESQRVKLYVKPLGNLRFNVMTQTYDDANMPEAQQIGAIIILNDIEAQLLIRPLSESPSPSEKDEIEIISGQVGSSEVSWGKDVGLAIPNESNFESEIRIGHTFTPRSIACHSLPSNPYEGPSVKPPNWEWSPQYFLDIMTKVKSLKAKVAPFSELQQRYNDITAKGRQMVFEAEVEWLWGSDISTLMEPHDLTEEDMAVSNRTVEHEENERMNKARAAAGKWVDPPELESPPEFWVKQGLLATRGQADEMLKEQEARKIWLKVYEELAGLYEAGEGVQPRASEMGLAASDLKQKSKRGPRKYSKGEKIAARKEWDELDRDANPITLEEWLESKFGCSPEGILNVPRSTFYGWPKS